MSQVSALVSPLVEEISVVVLYQRLKHLTRAFWDMTQEQTTGKETRCALESWPWADGKHPPLVAKRLAEKEDGPEEVSLDMFPVFMLCMKAKIQVG